MLNEKLFKFLKFGEINNFCTNIVKNLSYPCSQVLMHVFDFRESFRECTTLENAWKAVSGGVQSVDRL